MVRGGDIGVLFKGCSDDSSVAQAALDLKAGESARQPKSCGISSGIARQSEIIEPRPHGRIPDNDAIEHGRKALRQNHAFAATHGADEIEVGSGFCVVGGSGTKIRFLFQSTFSQRIRMTSSGRKPVSCEIKSTSRRGGGAFSRKCFSISASNTAVRSTSLPSECVVCGR